GIALAHPIGRAGYLREWLASGRAGSMEYLHRHFDKRIDPRELLEGAQSVVMTALGYDQPAPPRASDDKPRGRVARYAWGEDYHAVVKDKLFAMVDRLRTEVGEPFEAKVCVDTAPLLEREWAANAGVGWIGKNTLVLHHEIGSYFFLGGIVTTLDLRPDEPAADHCGTCTACLEACPTQAFPAPYEMDASRCVSYLTIEHRGEIPDDLRRGVGEWIFGCDVCQEVCPHNGRSPMTREPRLAVRRACPDPGIDAIVTFTDEAIRHQFRGTAVRRATPAMLRRNARLVGENLTRNGGKQTNPSA
ncbi:MAG: tRNA epoxyqueuosine(34) reductase QueG, partial [Planctomycetota bacterium]